MSSTQDLPAKLVELFFSFLQIGAVSFGGGYGILRSISYYVVEKHAWITVSEFKEIVAISNSTPGPIGVNAATFVGYKVAGLAGALVATAGAVLAPFIFSLGAARIYMNFARNGRMKAVLDIMKPAVLAMIAAAATNFLSTSLLSSEGILVTIFSLFALLFLKLDPAAVVLGCGLLWVIFFGRR